MRVCVLRVARLRTVVDKHVAVPHDNRLPPAGARVKSHGIRPSASMIPDIDRVADVIRAVVPAPRLARYQVRPARRGVIAYLESARSPVPLVLVGHEVV